MIMIPSLFLRKISLPLLDVMLQSFVDVYYYCYTVIWTCAYIYAYATFVHACTEIQRVGQPSELGHG